MKIFGKYFFACLLTLTYAVSAVGVTIYNCHCQHSNQIVLLADDDCECAHEHSHNIAETTCHDSYLAGEQCAKEEVSSHCCTVVVELLQIDQDVQPFSSKLIPDFYSLFSIDQPITVVAIEKPVVVTIAYSDLPPPTTKHSLLSYMAQWRL